MKNITVRKQIGYGMGTVVFLLLVIAGIAYFNVSGMLNDSQRSVSRSQLAELMKQKEIDHLVWMNTLMQFRADLTQEQLNLQTDDHKCGLGKWLYGDERKMAEEVMPELRPILKAMEEPHHKLHSSAIDIENHLQKIDTQGLLNILYKAKTDHLLWLNTVNRNIIERKSELEVQLDPRQCNFGKWFYAKNFKSLGKISAEFKQKLNTIENPHTELHEAGHELNNLLKSRSYTAALNFVESDIQPKVTRILGTLDELIGMVNGYAAERKKAEDIYNNVTVASVTRVQELMHQAGSLIDKEMNQAQAGMISSGKSSKSLVSIFSLISVILGVVIGYYIQKSLVGSLSKIVSGITEGANVVFSASSQVSESSQDLAAGASENASSLEESSAALEQMDALTKENSEKSDNAQNMIKEEIDVVETVSDHLTNMVTAMAEITQSSEETSKIVKTIEEIAFQTNLLALNAAVEAARAGEAGKGFSVVAEEVRNLAGRSAEAAKNTNLLIENIIKAVQKGDKFVKSTKESFDLDQEISKKIEVIIKEIAEFSKEQSEGIHQITIAVDQMDSVIQSNASSAEESASASEELSSQAESLKRMVYDLHKLIGDKSNGTYSGKLNIDGLVNKGKNLLNKKAHAVTGIAVKKSVTDEN